MSGTASRPPMAGAVTALTVHGPVGVVDLTVPADASLAEVSLAYAEQAGLAAPLPLVTRAGAPLQPSTLVGDAGLVPGSVLVAVDPAVSPGSGPGSRRSARPESGRAPVAPGVGSGTWLAVAVVVAVVAGWCATRMAADDRWPVVAVLLLGAFVGCLPLGALAAQRVLAAPAFAAAGALALAWDPEPARLPMVLGAAALAGAVTAALGRALAEPGSRAEPGLRVWVVVGAGWFALATLGVLTGVAPQVVWSVLFLLAVLGARFVPEVAVDVPDQYLIDLERLAVTAWSARERPRGRRGRIVVPPQAVTAVAAQGARTLAAASVAILVVAVLAGPLLLWSADLPLDRIGARFLVGLGGCALLLAARSYRHDLARRALRLAGVLSLGVLAVVLLDLFAGSRPGMVTLVAVGSLVLAGLLVLVAVLLGRGWRSAWWSRRAEVAEALCGSCAVASVVVAAGFFRHLWELTG